MQNKYLIVMSFDAVSSDDLSTLEHLPNFSKIINEGALIKNVETIYPSLTYPAHVTIVTGKYPKNHGIINNTIYKPQDKNPNWNWYGSKIKGKTIFKLAEEQGLTTSSILWPVTGKLSIDYNMPEIFCVKPWQNQLVMSALAGTIGYQYELNKKFGHIREGTKQPYLDDFALECAKYTINKYKPNLIFIHFIDVDYHRHKYGYESKEAKEALKRHDVRLGEILNTLKNVNILEDSTIIVLGDHSSINVRYLIRLNKVFLEKGLIDTDKNGNIKKYSVISKSCDGSAYIYIKDKGVKEEVISVLDNLRKKNRNAIEFILTKEEAIAKGADPNCDFMIEAKRGYYFVDEFEGKVIEEVSNEDIGKCHRYKATHGYSPTKDNYKTFFSAWGKGIKKGTIIDGGSLINHGPTLAKIIGIDLCNVDGKVEERIFNL